MRWSYPRSSAACTKSRMALGSLPISVCGKMTPSCMDRLLGYEGCERSGSQYAVSFPQDLLRVLYAACHDSIVWARGGSICYGTTRQWAASSLMLKNDLQQRHGFPPFPAGPTLDK